MEQEILPWVLWVTLAGLLVRIAHSGEFAPEFGILTLLAWIRTSLWLAGRMELQNTLALWYPVAQALAAEESIRHASLVNLKRDRIWRYWGSLSGGLVISSIAWELYPGGILTWRACSQIGILSSLVLSWGIGWNLRLSRPVQWPQRIRHNLLLVLLLGSVLSSRPGGSGWTIPTEIIHLGAFLGCYWTFPRRPRRESISASSSTRFFSASS